MINISQNLSSNFSLDSPPPSGLDADIKQAAQEFEAAYISQMLTFSGLGDALVSGEDNMASAFTGFFIEALSEDLAETGAFGLADKFYTQFKSKEGIS